MAPPDPADLMEQIIKATRVPDIIKQIPDYDGDTSSLHRWIINVDSVIQSFTDLNVQILPVWVNIIRSKIVGEADRALIATCAGPSWAEIKAKLIENFGDNRNLQTIMANIRMSMKNKSLQTYYLEANKLVADLSQNISLDPENQGHVPHIMRVVTHLVTAAFIDGMRNDYRQFVMARNPTSLVEANKAAVEWELASVRKSLSDAPKNFNNNKFPNSKPFNQKTVPSTSFQKPPNQNFQKNLLPFSQNVPTKFSNQNQNNQISENKDISMRTRRSNMSGISYQSNNVNNLEEEPELLEDSDETSNDEIFEENEELNFLLATADLNIT